MNDPQVHEEVLHGGVANAGAVVRVGDDVLRPSNVHSPTIHALLEHLHANGFDGVPEPIGLEPEGRERLRFIPGEVACPPFPRWFQGDASLASAAKLLRQYHDATVSFVPPAGATWSIEMADPRGSEVICHNDLCPENIVYRAGHAVALLDFDFAAPGRRVFDIGSFARMCVPIDLPEYAVLVGFTNFDPYHGLRVIADAYGLPPGRTELLDVMTEQTGRGGAFVRRRVEAGEPAFIEMWNRMGGAERYERRHEWFVSRRERFLNELG
ncbi:MAG: hypothetical protein QOE63_1260 [Acidimicrobiaceae bacterium]